MPGNVYDVIVIGAGPAGSAAARQCAEKGLKTLLLEKAKTPRIKCCTGMIMSRLTQNLIMQEFGKIPQEALAEPTYLKGYVIHVPGLGQQVVEWKAPFTWRNALDFWMNQRVKEAGGEIRESIRVDTLSEIERGYKLTTRAKDEEMEFKARWLIGADGAASTVRKYLFPELQVHYGQAIQEYHRCSLNLEKGWIHNFFPREYAPFYFGGYLKGDYAVVEGGARSEQMSAFIQLAKETLARDYGFNINSVFERKDGCVEPALFRELIAGQFVPARGNALLVGDSAGLLVPVSGEGIGLALKSGILAAEAVLESSRKGEKAANFYIRRLSAIIEIIKEFYTIAREIREKASKGENFLPQLTNTWQKTLDIG